MSLINQMLQDLDKRGADASAAGPLHAQIRPVKLPQTRKTLWVLLSLALLGAIVTWQLWKLFFPSVNGQQKTVPVTLAAAAAPASVPVAPPVALAATSQEAAAPAAMSLPAVAELPLLLKLSPGLDKTLIAETSASEKNASPPIIAKIERVPPDSGDKIKKIDPVPPPATAKSAEQATLASKFIKETTPAQQAESDYRQATLLQQQGRINDAVLMFEAALKSDPQHAAARQSLITLLLDNKRHEDAIRWLQQGLSMDKNQPGMAMILARLQVEKGKLPGAIETLQRTLPHAQDRADFLAFLAALQQRASHHKEAADLYQQALKKMPQNAVWWMGLGISLQADGRNQEALDAFGHAKSGNGLSPDLLAFVEQKITQLQR